MTVLTIIDSFDSFDNSGVVISPPWRLFHHCGGYFTTLEVFHHCGGYFTTMEVISRMRIYHLGGIYHRGGFTHLEVINHRVHHRGGY